MSDVYALRTVSVDKILRFTNMFITIINRASFSNGSIPRSFIRRSDYL